MILSSHFQVWFILCTGRTGYVPSKAKQTESTTKAPGKQKSAPGERFQGALFCTFCCRVAGRYTFLHRFLFTSVGTDIPKQHPPFLKNPKAFTQARG